VQAARKNELSKKIKKEVSASPLSLGRGVGGEAEKNIQ
jgi:hypothetical protein